MQKMFNVPHVLTPVSDDIMRNYLVEKVKEIGIDLGEECRLFSGMSITAYLPTFREAKRWLNMPLVMKTMCFSPVRAKDLEKEHFPLLSQYKPVGSGLSMPLDSVKINRDFWGTESRFKEPADYYFVQDAN